MPILTSFPFALFIALIVLNFVFIFSGEPWLQALSGLFAAALLLAALLTIVSVPGGRVIGGIVVVLAAVMALLLIQQAGYAI